MDLQKENGRDWTNENEELFKDKENFSGKCR
jgi:hypothetical protein